MGTVYSYTNLAKSTYEAAGTNITPSSENTTYTKANMFDAKASKPFKFLNAGDGSVVVDLGAAYNVQCIGVINHNFPAAAVITIDANSSDSFPNSATTITWQETNLYHYFSSAQSFRYWKLDLTTMGATVGRIGELWIGLAVSLPNPDFSLTMKRSADTIQNKTHYGITRELARARNNQINLSWGFLTSSDFTLVQDFYDYVKYSMETRNERPSPFLFIMDTDNPNDNNKSMFCRVSQELSLQQQTHTYYKASSDLILIEEPRGYVA